VRNLGSTLSRRATLLSLPMAAASFGFRGDSSSGPMPCPISGRP
jgi:hypothetical protein